MDLLTLMDEMIEKRSLLGHPFYRKWTAGILPKPALRQYVCEYHVFESNLPRFLSSLHARCEDPGVRQVLLENLWDEEHGEDNHVELWLRFAEAIGVTREAVAASEPSPATEDLVATYSRLSGEAPVAAGIAALYAYESQVPEVARAKMEGLAKHYGIADGPATEFFSVHSTVDVGHSAAERKAIEETTDHPGAVIQGASQALDAWWAFLDAVDVPA